MTSVNRESTENKKSQNSGKKILENSVVYHYVVHYKHQINLVPSLFSAAGSRQYETVNALEYTTLRVLQEKTI